MAQNRLLYLVSYLLSQCWTFMRLPFPGTDVPIGALLALPTIVGFIMRFLSNFFGVGGLGNVTPTLKSIKDSKK